MGAPVPVTVRAVEVAPPADGHSGIITSLQAGNRRHAALAVACTQQATLDLGGRREIHVRAVHYAVYKADIIDPESGEISAVTWTCLIQADGKIFKSTSLYGPPAVMMAARLFTPLDWEAGIHFHIRVELNAHNRPIHVWSIIDDPDE